MNNVETNVDKATMLRMWKDRAFRAQMKAEGLRAPGHPSGEPALTLDGTVAEWVTATCGNDTGSLCDWTNCEPTCTAGAPHPCA